MGFLCPFSSRTYLAIQFYDQLEEFNNIFFLWAPLTTMTTLKQHHDQEVHQWFTHFLPAPLSFYLSHKPHSSITFSSLLPSLIIIIITNSMQNASLSLFCISCHNTRRDQHSIFIYLFSLPQILWPFFSRDSDLFSAT